MRHLLSQKLVKNGLKNIFTTATACSFAARGGVRCGIHAPFSTTTTNEDDLVLTKIDEATGIATVTMNRPPVNSLSLEMFQALSASIKQVESNEQMQGLVLASSLPTVFSAGLDITEMHNPDPTRLKEFWYSFQQVYIDLYGSRLACMAAMAGHAPAAGTMLALSCDYRILTSTKATIGLNEAKLGIVAPPWLGQQLISTIGQREAEKALSLGILYTEHEALDVGLVDELALHSQVLKRAHDVAAKWTKIPPEARFESKMLARKQYIDHLEETRQQDTDHFCSFVQKESVQRNIGMYLESLKKKSK